MRRTPVERTLKRGHTMVSLSDIWNATLKGQRKTLPHTSVDLSGTIAIITGSNAGLGKEVAAKLASMNPPEN
jgi:hypothetical protein